MSSIHLRRRMHLEYKLRSDKQDILDRLKYKSQSITNDLDLIRDIEFGPYVLYPSPKRAEFPDSMLLFLVDRKGHRRAINGGHGVRAKRPRLCSSYGSASWRAMKRTHLREPFRLVIRMRTVTGDVLYHEFMEFAKDETNLGKIMDTIDLVYWRSKEEHTQRREEKMKEIWGPF